MFRDVVKGVAKNTSIMLLQQVITWASTFLLMLFLPRHLGPVEYGKLFLANAVVDIFRIFVAYGGNYVVAKNVAKDRANTGQILVDAAAFRTILAGIGIIALVAFTYAIDYPVDVRNIIFVMGINLFWQGIITPLYAAYQGHEMLQYTSAGAVAERVFVSVVAIAALFMGANTWIIALIIVLGNLANFVVLAVYIKKITTVFPRVDWQEAMSQIKSGIPYFLFAVFSTIYYRIDSLMLSKMSPGEIVGWYGGAFRLFDVLGFFPYILTIALFPVLSRLWKDSNETHKRTTQKSLEIVIMLGVLIGIGVFTYADKLVGMFYGLKAYEPSVLILQILTCGLLFLYVDMMLATMLMASEKQKQFSIVSLVAIPLKLALNYFLIRHFQSESGNGGIGAAIATALTELGIMVAALSITPKGVLHGFRVDVIWKTLLAGAVVVVTIWGLHSIGLNWILEVIVVSSVFLFVLLSTRAFEPAEETLIRSLITVDGWRKTLDMLRKN